MMYRYWFMELKGVGNVIKHRLFDVFGSAKAIYHLSEQELRECGFLQERQIQAVLAGRNTWKLEEEYQKICGTGQRMITLEEADYPYLLTKIYEAPYGLYFLGNLPQKKQKTAAIVGARCCSEYGKKMAGELAGALAQCGYDIVSGMAKGIDTFAHRGALDAGGSTVAILGSGTDVCYPKENKYLYEEIKSKGCVISEYPPGTPPLARQFPARNRIISGMAKLVIVVEAQEKSGSLITMDYALEQGRDIYAVPGRITDCLSAGCNRLLAQGAGIITSVEDFIHNIEEIDVSELGLSFSKNENDFVLEKIECMVYSCFDFYPKSLEQVLQESALDLLTLLSTVMDLCDKGYLREVFKNQYIKCK